MKALSTLTLIAIVWFGLLNQESKTEQAEWDSYNNRWINVYSHKTDSFFELGDDAYRVEWLSDSEENILGCARYIFCNHIRLASLEPCVGDLEITYEILSRSGSKAKRSSTHVKAPTIGSFRIVEFGVSSANAKEMLLKPLNARCDFSPVSL